MDINPENWRVERVVLQGPPEDKGKVRYLLQHKRFDASAPYWLTYRVYKTGSEGALNLTRLLKGKKV